MVSRMGPGTLKIFFSYAHKDEKLREELEKHLSLLKRQGQITHWSDREIPPGKEWAGEIDEHLKTAHIILLLVSPDFIHSDYCWSHEIKLAVERHTAEEAIVIPVILRPADWRTGLFGRLKALPKDAKPVTKWRSHDEAFLDIEEGIRKAIEEIHAKRAAMAHTPISQRAAVLAYVTKGIRRAGEGLQIKRTDTLPPEEYRRSKRRELAVIDLVGQRRGNYRLIRQLGHGGFAEVYLGEHIHLSKRRVAIKVLRTRLTRDNVQDFQREANIIANLKHPNIVQIHDFGYERDTPYLVMEFAPYGSLRYPKGTQLPSATIVPYVNQTAAALQYAHRSRLIHRDVKPENLLLGPNNEVLLSDFGIAIVESTRSQMPQQEMAGTAAYMAPEQIQGRASPASDQYSLAVVIYEWLSGGLPFTGSYVEIINQHQFASPTPLHETIPTIPPAVEEVVMKALAKESANRYASVQDFAKALERASEAFRLSSTSDVEEDSESPPEGERPENGAHALAVASLTEQGPDDQRPWYKRWGRDILAVVLTAGLYLVIAGSAIAFLSSPPGDVASFVLWILPFVMGILAVVSSRRKGFDGLVPALISGFAGGCVFLIMASALLGVVPIEFVLRDLAIYAFLSLLGATTYVGIKKLWVRFRQKRPE